MKTYFQSKEEAVGASKWRVVDASGVPVGRLASEVAALIRGKHRPQFTSHADGGDFVIVLNAEKVILTGAKGKTKTYHYHTGYFGGIKDVSAERLLQKNPRKVIDLAVRGMLPKGPLGRKMARKLKVYTGDKHPHSAQQPEPHELAFQRKRKAA